MNNRLLRVLLPGEGEALDRLVEEAVVEDRGRRRGDGGRGGMGGMFNSLVGCSIDDGIVASRKE